MVDTQFHPDNKNSLLLSVEFATLEIFTCYFLVSLLVAVAPGLLPDDSLRCTFMLVSLFLHKTAEDSYI